MRRFALLSTFSLALASIAQAGSVVPGDISRDAKWFGHVNVEAINSMEVVEQFRAKMDKDGRLKKRMHELSDQIGINPMEDLRGVTIYATQYEGDVGVGLFYVKNVDRKKMIAALEKRQPDHKSSRYGDRTLYTWTVKHPRGQMELTGTFASKKLIVIGSDQGHVKAALDVLDGKKDGMRKDSPLLTVASKRSLFVSNALDVPEEYQQSTKCPVLRRCKAASVNWSAKKGAIKAKYVFTTESEDTARGLKGMIDAGMAMGSMRFREDGGSSKGAGRPEIQGQGRSLHPHLGDNRGRHRGRRQAGDGKSRPIGASRPPRPREEIDLLAGASRRRASLNQPLFAGRLRSLSASRALRLRCRWPDRPAARRRHSL